MSRSAYCRNGQHWACRGKATTRRTSCTCACHVEDGSDMRSSRSSEKRPFSDLSSEKGKRMPRRRKTSKITAVIADTSHAVNPEDWHLRIQPRSGLESHEENRIMDRVISLLSPSILSGLVNVDLACQGTDESVKRVSEAALSHFLEGE